MSLNLGTIQSSKNTSNLIADALRTAILEGKLQGGQQLKQDIIATEFKVSKIPVREALFLLQAEGLVNMMPNRGASVSQLSYAEIDEIYSMRLSLEILALQRAIPNMTAANLADSEVILKRIDNEDDMQKWGELNWRFHASLYKPADMPRLLATVNTLHTNVARYLTSTSLGDLAYLANSQKEHYRILALCRDGNVDAAVSMLDSHLRGPMQKLADFVDQSDR